MKENSSASAYTKTIKRYDETGSHVLVLLTPTKEGLQQHLDLMHRFCQTWALTVNLSKTKIMVFQKRYSHKDHKFHLDTVALEHTKNYTYLGLNISATGNFHKGVNDLRDKARRAV